MHAKLHLRLKTIFITYFYGGATNPGPTRIKNDVNFLKFPTCLQINSCDVSAGMGQEKLGQKQKQILIPAKHLTL